MKQTFFILFLSLVFTACQTPQKKTTEENKTPVTLVEANLKVTGMTCTGCEQSIATAVTKLTGIDSISANHLDSTAFVRFDASKTDLATITKSIEGRGFQVEPN